MGNNNRIMMLILCVLVLVILVFSMLYVPHEKEYLIIPANVTEIRVVQDRVTQLSWSITDVEDINIVLHMFEELTLGDPVSGGFAGSFLRVQFYSGTDKLGEITFAEENLLQSSMETSVVLIPVLAGAWTEAEWYSFLNK
jgi:hypothetical protein